jgi:hypothetical protein
MRYHIILGLLAVVAGSAAAPPVARKGKKPNYTASFPPLGSVNHNVVHVANLEQEPGIPAFSDIQAVSNPGDQVAVEGREREWKEPVYQMALDGKLNGVSPTVRDLVLKKLTTTNFAPFDRMQYFAWCNREHLAVVGWTGHVQAFTKKPGGLLIQVRVTPQLRQRGVVAPATLDGFTEYYLLDKQFNLNYVSGHGQQAFKGSLIEF